MEDLSLREVHKIEVINTIETYPDGPKIHILKTGDKFKELPKEYRLLRYPENKSFYNEIKIQSMVLNNIPYFTFPKQIVASKTRLHGYIAKFAPGNSLYDEIPALNNEYIIDMIESIENSIIKITEKGCQIEDLHPGNIVLTENEFSVIDTDMYCFSHNKNYKMLLECNLRQLTNCILSLLAPKIDIIKLYSDSEFKIAYYKVREGKMKCSDFIKLLINKSYLDCFVNNEENKKITKL